MIEMLVIENQIEICRICRFLKCTENEVLEMYKAKSLDADILLCWSKLTEYDFFRVYSQHLLLFSPQKALYKSTTSKDKSELPHFRKNIYTKELIDFVIELIETNQKTKVQIIEEYRIPKTTLYKWIAKYTAPKT